MNARMPMTASGLCCALFLLVACGQPDGTNAEPPAAASADAEQAGTSPVSSCEFDSAATDQTFDLVIS